jgi:hypothetical protein
VHTILTQGQENVHDRKREEHAGIDEDSSHHSVGEAGFGYSVGDLTPSFSALLTPGAERQDVREPDPTRPAPGPAFRGNLSVVEESDHERTR